MILAYKETQEFLQKQMKGLTGHIEVAGYPFDSVEWGKEDKIGKDELYTWGSTWWAYEQTAYWIDGFIRCAILLRDKSALKRAETIIYTVFQNADPDGYIGPKFLKEVKDGYTRWPHVVFFRAVMALYEYNQDETILGRLTRHYLDCPVDYAYACGRDILNVEIMLWLYEKTGNRELLNLAVKSYTNYNENSKDKVCSEKFALSSKLPRGTHGVSYNEYSKLGAILYKYIGEEKCLRASVSAYKKLNHYMLPDGLHTCSENIVSAASYAHHETCNVTDFSWSQNYLYEASGDTAYLDKIEKCVWNAGLGSVTEDFKALQYFSSMNQVVMDEGSLVGPWNIQGAAYRPAPWVQCCIANVNRFMPNYILNSWKKIGEDVYLKLFCSSIFKEDGIEIKERTSYPYNNSIILNIKTKKPFCLHLRLPKWNEGYNLLVNGREYKGKARKGFIALQILGNCMVEYEIKCSVKKRIKNDYVWFEKGALVYTYKVDSLRRIDTGEKRSTKEFPAYCIYPTAKWNYGVADNGEIIEKDGRIFIQAYEVDNWRLKVFDNGRHTKLPLPPSNPTVREQDPEWLELTPYGLSECRITAFAHIK